MSRVLDRQLLEAVENGNFVGVRDALEMGADVNASDGEALNKAVSIPYPEAFKIVRCLVEHGANVTKEYDDPVLSYAVESVNKDQFAIIGYLVENGANIDENGGWVMRQLSCSNDPRALNIIKYLIELGADTHLTTEDDFNWYGTPVSAAIEHENNKIADFYLSRDDFLLSDLIPQDRGISFDAYKEYRDKAILHVSKVIDAKGLPYAQVVAADIAKILKTEYPESPTREEVEALQPLVRKIASKDWVGDARVSSDDFTDCNVDVER